MKDSGDQMKDTGYQMKDAGYLMKDAEYQMKDAEYQIPDEVLVLDENNFASTVDWVPDEGCCVSDA